MMDKNEIKLLRAFLIESKMTQKEFAAEAGICERTLRTAIKTGKVCEKTRIKIYNAMLAESIQKKIVIDESEYMEDKEPLFGRVLKYVLTLCLGILGVLTVLLLLS